jgi:hypothetical protein
LLAALATLCLAASCRKTKDQVPAPEANPTLRVWLLSTLAGALEPCGCQKDMLGGVDHAASLTSRGSNGAQLLLGAGPLFFLNPGLDEQAKTQELWKAEALADSLASMKLVAWAPGANDWAAGAATMQSLAKRARAKPLAANLGGANTGSVHFAHAGGLKVGIVGVSSPLISASPPEGVRVSDAEAALKKAAKALDAEKAQVRIALLSLKRGEALRLAENVGGFHLVVIGKPFDRGEANDAPTPPVLLGKTLVVEAPNHLQAMARVDFYVRGGSLEFADGTGVAVAEQRTRLSSRLRDLSERISAWEKRSDIKAADLDARKKERDAVAKELGALKEPAPPKEGSYFRYSLEEVKQSAGEDPNVEKKLLAYFKRVNDHNREAFKDRKPAEPPEGASRYIGVNACAVCHAEEYRFWKKTGHARAYATLVDEHKQFNLDCVSCHVTGYEKPGGSTVTHVEKLENVGCENCHGPGSRHVDDPQNKELMRTGPEKSLCATECHHVPHVSKSWSVDEAWKQIVGPGHGSK